MPKRRLIITADDFGVHPLIDDAINQAIQTGLVTSVAAFANGLPLLGNSCPQRVRMLQKDNPHVSIGLHFTITSGRPISNEVKRLTKRNGTFKGIGQQHAHKVSKDALKAELKAQIFKTLSFYGDG